MKKIFTLLSITFLACAVHGQVAISDLWVPTGDKETFIQELNIYPNPTSTGNFALKTDQELTVKVYNLIGKEIISRTFQVFQGLNEETFNLNGKPKGVYILEVSQGDKKEIQRISFI